MTGRGRKARNPSRIDRTERLAAALRQNMKRRKVQARARAKARDAEVRTSHDSAGIVPEKSRD
jgi:hypothetical protein